MTLALFDVQSGFGGGATGLTSIVSPEDWTGEMDRLAIGRALVRLTPEDMDRDVMDSNARLLGACKDEPRLTPCPVVLPAACGDVPTEADQVDAAVEGGAAAVWLRPQHDAWTLEPWNCDRLMAALQQRRMPVLCLERMICLESVA